MSTLSTKVLERLKAKGWTGGIVPVTRLQDLERDLSLLQEQGLIFKEVKELYLDKFKYDVPQELPDASSIIVVAAPQPKRRIHFAYRGKDLATIVPPTYANAWNVINDVKSTLEEITFAEGGRFERASLPLKTLAARTGVAKYGRNNITYVPEHGSFNRLVAYYTNLDLGLDQWQEKEALPACKTCDLCLRACPASVISRDRFVIRVERCLTFLNELPVDRPFPPEVRPQWHNAIVGCMRCQEACPYDQKIKTWIEEGESFSEEETEYLLKGDFSDPSSKVMNEKLERNGLDLTIFPRNLVALLGR